MTPPKLNNSTVTNTTDSEADLKKLIIRIISEIK
jgi:hypothetical protein